MARIKITSTDIYARLARGECANYRNNCCLGRTPCTIINGEPCQYFATYVKPLLDQTDFSAKYAREAKISVALNPRAKVVRKRRTAETLTIETPTPPVVAAPAKRPPVATRVAATPPVVMPVAPSPARPSVTPAPSPPPPSAPAVPSAKPPASSVPELPQLSFELELTPSAAPKGKVTAKRQPLRPR